MIKNRYVIGAITLLLVVFIAVLFIVPTFQVEQPESMAKTYKSTVFDQSKVTKVDIELSDKNLASILESPTDEEVVDADVTINGKTVSHVGFRTKGMLSLSSVAAMEDSDRYSWKIDFDYYRSEQTLDGLQKLALNNNFSDASMMREYLSYDLMEDMGVPTPSHSYMYVTINGEEQGLYLGVETLDESFLSQNFTTGNGDLYKPDGTGSDLKWISDDIADYTGLNLKTNTKTSKQSSMINMLDTINNGGKLEDVVDVDEMLRYFAANTALVNLDHYQGDKKHNYYLYEEDGLFSMLPWDYNMAFGGYGAMGGGMGGKAKDTSAEDTQAKETTEAGEAKKAQMPGGGKEGGMMGMGSSSFINDSAINFSITTPVSGATLEERPLLNALLEDDENRETFNKYLKKMATGFFSEETITEKVSEITSMITPYVEKDPTKFYTMEEYLKATTGDESIIEFSTQRAESILAQLSGELVVEAETSSDMGGGQEQGQMQPPDVTTGEAQDKGMQPPAGQDGAGPGAGGPPNMGGGQNGPPDMGGGMQPPGMDGGPNAQSGAAGSSYSKETFIMIGISLALLIGAIVFASFFKRRRS
ncbi:CotH kinase family protein [Peribacillus psychrosaccharolyticus]|uniref:CotH kinase family protein n=2 Tax=Peribacillus psychrosaccharolyticus TaxID=1407 RepID=A0A974S054_PERPY|nr:CotH kinase family protein [Peribacillus psychrosaccharolyticus]MEC2055220.1 CotH kinase family protein [Peribacillus psychrosaccharolyticus]MED3745210.1 CotH kinase family protein [Peribacillus psychrosaccharolyticus]QQS98929.1 CotH kinase family protein [Peribacillus psychrosaccharolyticus]